VIDVVREPHGNAARRGSRQRVADDVRERVRQVDVVDRDRERAARGRDPVGEGVGDLLRGLPAVEERPDGYAFDFSAALCARLAAW
jgi:hypothetical protein